MTGSGANGGTPAQAVSSRMAALRDEFVDFISQLVLEESPSTEPGAQRGIRAILTETLSDVGLDVEHIPGQASGGHLLARSPGAAAGRAATDGPRRGGAASRGTHGHRVARRHAA